MPEFDDIPIDPAVQKAADELRTAYRKLQEAQDTLVKPVTKKRGGGKIGKGGYSHSRL